MQRDDSQSTSRRTFVKYGLVSTGTVIGTTGAVTGARDEDGEDRTESDPGSDVPLAERGVMFPYQLVRGRAFTVVERDLEWRPAALESSRRTHVISYDHAPSLRAFVFTAADECLRADRSFAFDGVRGSPETGRDLVTVGIDAGSPADADAR